MWLHGNDTPYNVFLLFPYNWFIHIAKSLSVTEKALLISVMMSLSSNFFEADWTELADVRL